MHYRIGAAFGVAGAALGGAANIAHPAPSGNALDAQVRLVAASDTWVPIHLAILVGGLLVAGGLLAVSRSISGAAGTALARIAYSVTLIGIALNTIEMATDGVALKLAATAWMAAPDSDKSAAFYGAYAISRIGAGLAFLQVVTFFGMAIGLFGVAIALGRGYSAWLGWTGVAIGALNLLLGLARALSPSAIMVPIGIPVSLGLIWIIAACVLLWQRASGAKLAATELPRGGAQG